MKRFMALLVMIVFTAAMLAGCVFENGPASSESYDVMDPAQELLKEKQACKEVYDNARVDLLSSKIVAFEDAYIEQYVNAYEGQYPVATIATIGVELAGEKDYQYLHEIAVCGPTAEDENGEPALHTASEAVWFNEDYTYCLFVVRIGGEVDFTKAVCRLSGKSGMSVDKAFSSNGEALGFESAIAAFAEAGSQYNAPSRIVELDGRHYMIEKRFRSAETIQNDADGCVYARSESYVFVPLENGLTRTLSLKNVRADVKEHEHITWDLSLNDEDKLAKEALDCQTVVSLNVKRAVPEQTELGEVSRENRKIASDAVSSFLAAAQLVVNAEEENEVVLKMGNPVW